MVASVAFSTKLASICTVELFWRSAMAAVKASALVCSGCSANFSCSIVSICSFREVMVVSSVMRMETPAVVWVV